MTLLPEANEFFLLLFTGWCKSADMSEDFELLDPNSFASMLRGFYAEVRKMDGSMYAKQTYVGLRASIHRHITGEPFHRQINIIQDREFQAANHVFLGMLRKMKKDGLD